MYKSTLLSYLDKQVCVNSHILPLSFHAFVQFKYFYLPSSIKKNTITIQYRKKITEKINAIQYRKENYIALAYPNKANKQTKNYKATFYNQLVLHYVEKNIPRVKITTFKDTTKLDIWYWV